MIVSGQIRGNVFHLAYVVDGDVNGKHSFTTKNVKHNFSGTYTFSMPEKQGLT